MEKKNPDKVEEEILEQILIWINNHPLLTKEHFENRLTEEIKRKGYLKEDWQVNYAKERIKEKIKKEMKEGKFKKENLNKLLGQRKYSGWQRHFTPKNFLINALISLIPASIIIGILREEVVLRDIVGPFFSSIILVGVIFGFIYLAGTAREKVNKSKYRNIIIAIMIVVAIILIAFLVTDL